MLRSRPADGALPRRSWLGGFAIAPTASSFNERPLTAQNRISVIEEISPHDEMYGGDPERYFKVGQSAIDFIQPALRATGLPAPERILDLPCGHGRVLRFLKAVFPNAELVACDINRDGVDFCAETFGARPVYSVDDARRVELPGTFDLIWCGS